MRNNYYLVSFTIKHMFFYRQLLNGPFSLKSLCPKFNSNSSSSYHNQILN